jgi:hypothetical protein
VDLTFKDMKTITKDEVVKLVQRWFELKQFSDDKIFNSMPLLYEIEIDRNENIFIYAHWGNVDDYYGLGNMYKWLWQNSLPKY